MPACTSMSTSSAWSSTRGMGAMRPLRQSEVQHPHEKGRVPSGRRASDLWQPRPLPDPRREPGHGESGNRAQRLSHRARASATAWRSRRDAEHLPQRPRRESGRARRISRVKQAFPCEVSPTMLADTKSRRMSSTPGFLLCIIF